MHLRQDQTKSLVDLALRERTLILLGRSAMEEVREILNLAASAAIEGVCSASTPFLLFADLINTRPITEAEANFHFLEETIKVLEKVRAPPLAICSSDRQNELNPNSECLCFNYVPRFNTQPNKNSTS